MKNMKDDLEQLETPLIRPAALRDADRIAYLTYLAGRSQVDVSIFDFMFPGPGGPTGERLGEMARLLYAQTVSWFHHSYCTVAEVEGVAAASLFTFTKNESRLGKLLKAFKEIGWTDDDLSAMGGRMQPYLRAEFPLPDGAWIIESVACYEEFRRRGLVSALLADAIDRGLNNGHQFITLNTFIGNDAAISAYEKAGLRIIGEKRDPQFARVFDCPGMYQMAIQPSKQ
jgi:ribosomal protein S18 acetylase RimI-like enzyme